jgi:predicted Zn-dependent protease
MKSTFLSCALAVGLLLMPPQALIAQSSLPSLGDDAAMTLGAERRLGDQIGKEIYADAEYVADTVLDAYLQKLWQPLMTAAKDRGELPPEMSEALAWRLFLVRDKSVNAFALPGGYFGVHLGLMALVDTPDELASVLAHELTHVTQRHIARGMSKQAAAAPWLMASILLGLLAARSNANIASAAIATGQAGAAQNQINYTRDMEREADRIGFTLMAPAGYAPSGFVAMFQKLNYAARLSDNGSYPYLRSHPLTTARIADMTNRLQELGAASERAPATSASAAQLALHQLMQARARVLADLSIDAQKQHLALVQSSPSPTPPLLYAGALAAWQLGDAALAKSLYARLQALLKPDAPTDVQNAIKWLGAELQWPVTLTLDSPIRAEMLYAAQRIANAAAIARLQTWLSETPSDAEAWSLLSRLQLASGQRIKAAMSEAEAKRAKLDDSAALAGYLTAQNLIRQSAGLPIDAIDAAIVDSKVRELQLRVRER